MTRRGFTLVELVAAAAITAVVVGGVAIAMGRLVASRDLSASRSELTSSAHRAAGEIALDVVQALRERDLRLARVRIDDGRTATGDADELLLIARSRRPVRPGVLEPEGGEYEVQYRLGMLPGPGGGAAPALWRRADAAVDDQPEGGGVARAVAVNVMSLSLEAWDGTSWTEVWDSDFDGIPHAVRIGVTARDPRTGRSVLSRRVAAIDRSPAPIDTGALEEAAEAAGGAP